MTGLEQLISIGWQLQDIEYFRIASATILYYEYILTFHDEMEIFWTKKLTWGNMIFMGVRYLTVFGHVPILLEEFGRWSNQVCSNLQYYHQGLLVIVQTLVTSLLILRAYALYECSLVILGSLYAIGLTAIAFGIWGLAATIKSNRDHVLDRTFSILVGCDLEDITHQSFANGLPWAVLLVLDAIIFALTLYKTISMAKNSPYRLTRLIMRDGTMYFGVLSVINVVNVVIFATAPPILKAINVDLANVMGVVLISRLTINLHKNFLSHSATVGITPTSLAFWAANSADDDELDDTMVSHEREESESLPQA